MKKNRFIRQARLPEAAREYDLAETLGYYKKRAMTSNFNKSVPIEKRSQWDIAKEHHFLYGWIFKVYCPVCKQLVLSYRDGIKLKPREVEHCELHDTFYIGEEIALP